MKSLAPAATSPRPGSRLSARQQRLILLVGAALLVLLAEIAWFSAPVQDWWIARQPLERLARLVHEQPGSTRVRFFYARALLHAGRSAEALEQAQAGTVMEPTSARLFRVAGLAAMAEGKASTAWSFLARASQLGDTSPSLFEAMAQLEIQRHRMGPAMRLLEESVRRHPRRATSWYWLGVARLELGMPNGAVEAHRQAVRLAPGEALHWVGLAEALLFLNRDREALAASERALAVDPLHPDALLARARSLAMRARTPAEVANADAAFRQARTAGVSDPAAAVLVDREYGRFLLEQGRPREAIEPLERACRALPEDETAAYALARACRRAGEAGRADAVMRRFEMTSARARQIRNLEARLIADPENAAVRRAYARALKQGGRTEEAHPHGEQVRRSARSSDR